MKNTTNALNRQRPNGFRRSSRHGGFMPYRSLFSFLIIMMMSLVLCTTTMAGSGFHVSDSRLLDGNGNSFIMRGVNHPHVWFTHRTPQAISDIASVGANTVRVVLGNGEQWGPTPASEVADIIQQLKDNKMIAVLEVHDVTGYPEQSTAAPLSTAVDYWLSIKDVLVGEEDYVIINIGNEPLGNDVDAEIWSQAHIDAITTLRKAGLTHTLMVDAANWGQDWEGIMLSDAPLVFAADPLGNTVFSVHMYQVYSQRSTIDNYMSTFVNEHQLPLVVGEFGADHNGENVDEASIMELAEQYKIGYLGWSWSGNNSEVASLDITIDFNVDNLSTWGDFLVNSTYGIRNTSQIASVFDGSDADSDDAADDGTEDDTDTDTDDNTDTGPASLCQVDYTVNQWNTGFTAYVTITNNGSSPIDGWALTWTFADGQQIIGSWNADVSQSGAQVTASNDTGHWNGTIAANGGTVSFGFQAAYSGPNSIPVDFKLNGGALNGDSNDGNDTEDGDNTDDAAAADEDGDTDDAAGEDTVDDAENDSSGGAGTAEEDSGIGQQGLCQVDYRTNDWSTGFTADVTISNNGTSPIEGWALTWTFADGQQITGSWNADVSQSGAQVTASNDAGHWNGAIAANGGRVSFGFQGTHSGTNSIPSDFKLNGMACNGSADDTDGSDDTDDSDNSDDGDDTDNGDDTDGGDNADGGDDSATGDHVDNPFENTDAYINPDYAAKVLEAASRESGTLGQQMARVADYSTAIWMDRIAAIEGSSDVMGLRDHLDAALEQQNGDTPLTIMVVIYDLPNRDCAALASNGELRIADDGLNIYKADYIDPIVEILSDAKYSSLRIVAIVEPDSLPNLITNLDIEDCAEANSSGAYVDGIQYTIDSLHPLPNVYLYLDIAHSGWLGWDSNFNPAVQLYTSMLQGTQDGLASIDGFITNTANYTPIGEVYLPNPDLNVGGQQIKSADFYEWNPYFDELDYAAALRNAFINTGLPSTIGMLIDTSRNGWGGDERPDSVSTSTDLNTYVDESRIDRRPHRGGWCNQSGAGIGARPQADPQAGIDAYVWVKPPGESDGVSADGITDPDDPSKQFDAMCDPDAQNRYNTDYPTNALPDAPHAGRWFSDQFRMLVENAHPSF